MPCAFVSQLALLLLLTLLSLLLLLLAQVHQRP
jgi:hypothetical protein